MAKGEEGGSRGFNLRNVVANIVRMIGVAVVLVLVVAAVAVWQEPLRWRLFAQDYFTLASHEPSALERRWSDDLQLTDRGKDIFYASRPELIESDEFSEFCPTKEETNVLGCYLTSSKIYVLDVEVEEIEEVEEVTLAHEILHGVWDRLSGDTQASLERQLLEYYRQIDDDELNKLIAGYRRSAPVGQADAVTATELHSIFGTEYPDLSEQLEEHYAQYFKDRSVVVELYQSYDDEFDSRQDRATELSNQLDQLNSEIADKNSLIDQQIARNQRLVSEIEQLRNDGRTEESNELVPVQNQLVDQINANIADLNEMIERFNSIQRSYEQLSFELNELYDSLDTRSPVQ